MDVVTLGILMYLVGAIVAILWPYINKFLSENVSFDYKQVLAKVIGAVLGALLIISVPSFAETLVEQAGLYDYAVLYAINVFVLAFGSATIGELAKKTGQAVNAKRQS